MNGNPAINHPALDVRHLPHSALDHRSPIWWGNLLLLAIETTMFVILVAAYFYYRSNFNAWPPPRTNGVAENISPLPDLPLASLNLLILLISLAPAIWADRSALNRKSWSATVALLTCILFGALLITLRFFEFKSLHFRWDENAYASTVWTIMGVHLTHLIVGTLESVVMFLWLMLKGMDDKHARDVRVDAAYWYWIVGIWIPLYAIIYWAPRIL